jgi:bifunctional aspartokinase / homoserine dehydrogenase 1
MRVLKFGGTSVKNSENINKSIAIVEQKLKDDKVLVVVSAFGGITNKLIEVSEKAALGDNTYTTTVKEIEIIHIDAIKELISPKNQHHVVEHVRMMLKNFDDLLHGIYLIKELSLRTQDIILSFGELLSAYIVSSAMREKGINSEYLDAREVIKTDKSFGSAKVDFKITNKLILEKTTRQDAVYVATGFIASTHDDETSTLGRGGSDYTAAIFGAALNASIIEIWTDVSGMYTSDPRKVRKAYPIKNLSYAEAMELSHFGAKVLEPRTVLPAMAKKIPVIIKNTFEPEAEGTLITETSIDQTKTIRGISSIDNISLVTVSGSGMKGEKGVAMRLFGAISKNNINIILITQGSSEQSITFAVSPKDTDLAQKVLQQEFNSEIDLGLVESIKVERNLSVIAIVGENMKNISGISGKLFKALGRNGINVIAIAQGASELNISVVISNKDDSKALNAIHEEFFLSGVKTLNVFVVGTGVIGGTLLKQIEAQNPTLIKNNATEVRVIGIMNVDGFIIDEKGLDLQNWENEIKTSGVKPELDKFVEQIIKLNLRNSVFVDNTGSYDVASKYEALLKEAVSVVTPNKVANASDFDRYANIHKIAKKSGARFLYETNVGAGLPIINTLKDLVKSGDEILKIEAILSGSLNYIFSNVSSTKDFASTVKDARQLGYTEPDPKLDLSGMDVARKILILSREIGKEINLSDIQIENCLTTESQNTKTVEELWETLDKYDNPIFAERIKNAEEQGKRLKYVATFENGISKTEVKEVGPEHPFYNIKGSDNIISFTTARYKTQPLIVIGPGAGAEVTAAGVFADIIRIVNF